MKVLFKLEREIWNEGSKLVEVDIHKIYWMQDEQWKKISSQSKKRCVD